jgi:hypothetical protein
MFCEYMFRCYLFSFILLFSTSSMFELHVVVAAVAMLNILKLIMEIVSNYPTKACPTFSFSPLKFCVGLNFEHPKLNSWIRPCW